MFPSYSDIDNVTLQFDSFGDHFLITITAKALLAVFVTAGCPDSTLGIQKNGVHGS